MPTVSLPVVRVRSILLILLHFLLKHHHQNNKAAAAVQEYCFIIKRPSSPPTRTSNVLRVPVGLPVVSSPSLPVHVRSVQILVQQQAHAAATRRPPRTVLRVQKLKVESSNAEENDEQDDDPVDTVRVRIWKALASADKELSLKQLGAIVGERHLGDLKSHLVHVEKQAKTFGNKSREWKERRGLLVGDRKRKKAKIQKRRGEKGMVYIWLE